MKPIDLRRRIGEDETIYWQGTPDRKAFLLKSIFNFLLPIAIVWAIFDFGFLAGTLFSDPEDGSPEWFLIPFLMLHLMPVWIYVFGVVTSVRRFRNTAYLVTDRAVYLSGGAFSVNLEVHPLAKISNINVRQGIIDRRIGVGSVILDGGNTARPWVNAERREGEFVIGNIPDYESVFALIRRLQTDAVRDTMYPNELRPENR